MKRRAFLAGATALGVAGCAASSNKLSPMEAVRRVRYRHPGPSAIALITVMNVGSDNGAHTALMINASERVIFDPAGSFVHETIPERNDVVFGVNPAVMDFYIDFHTRREFYTVTQYLPIRADAAENLLQRTLLAGPVPGAFCTSATSRLLRETPGLEQLGQSFFPDSFMDQFGRLPGIVTKVWRDDDPDRQSARLFDWTGQPSRFSIE